MEPFASSLRYTAEPVWRHEKDAPILSTDNDEEIFHVQADGFYGPEKGFHDAEELRRQ
jgi:hypothetical protein